MYILTPKEKTIRKTKAQMGSEWLLGRLAGGCGVDPAGSGQGLVASSCKYGDEPLVSGATDLVTYGNDTNPLAYGLILSFGTDR
jgi:hypothetical protein